MATADLRGQQDAREQQDRLRANGLAPPSTAAAVSTGGSFIEAACGLAVVALAIAGLAHAYPIILAGIAQIVFGVSLLSADGAVAAYFARTSRRGSRIDRKS